MAQMMKKTANVLEYKVDINAIFTGRNEVGPR